jgi:hypothetical protein
MSFVVGERVWAKMPTYPPWPAVVWPLVVLIVTPQVAEIKGSEYVVIFYGTLERFDRSCNALCDLAGAL